MHSRIIHITLLAVAFILAFSVSPSPAQEVPSQYEQDLLQLINEARENPLAVAGSLGMDTDQILQDFPELNDIFINGLPPLSFNENLYAAAGAHTNDMLENNYYSHTSLDGRTYDDRIIESGCDPVVTGESLGMLAFFNFIQPADAVELIFENMFRDELDTARTERRNILAGDLEEVGIGFGSGAFKIDGSTYNVYLTTCDFAAGDPSVIEMELLELINQARGNPLAVAASLDMDTDQILEELPELREILIEGLPPLNFNQKLYAAARAHIRDMVENGYYGHTSLDGRSFEDRIVESGYEPVATGESLGMLWFSEFIEPVEAVRSIFENMFRAELDPSMEEQRNILNPDLKEAGIGFGVGVFESGSALWDVYLTICDFGTSIMDEDPCLKGLVYEDLDRNGLYSLGEGIPEIAVTIEGSDTLLNLFTNVAGGFEVSLEPGFYHVIALIDDDPMECWVEMEEGNLAVWFKME